MSTVKARDAMIAAAEQLVAERGMAALTLKDVQQAANQSNKSAAQYHFGSRHGLLTAVVQAGMDPVNERRAEILDRWEENGVVPTVRQAVEALVGPLAAETVWRPGSYQARFLAQLITDPALTDIVQHSLAADSLRRVRALLMERTHVSPELAQHRVGAVLSLVTVTLARYEARRLPVDTIVTLVSDLVETCLAVLAAPEPATTIDLIEYEGVSP